MKDQLLFDTTDANTIAESDHVGAHTLAGDGSLITSGDGDSDNLSTTTLEGLDVRSFMHGYDASGDNWDRIQQVSGAVKVYIDDGDFEVDVVINAEKDEDAAHSSGDTGNYVLAVRQDTLAASTSADGDYASFKVDSVGSLYTKDTDAAALLTTIDADTSNIASDTAAMVVDLAAIEVEQLAQGVTLDAILVDTGTIAGDTTSMDATLTALSKAEDSVHGSGDQGIMSLAVRNDAGTALAADGDYIPFSTDSSGALYTNIVNDISVNDAALADTAIANAVNTLAVASTAEDVVASPLANRKYLLIYNKDNRQMFVGASGVTAANGFPISPGSALELRAGASIDIEYVSEKLGHEIRTLELS